MKPMRPSSSSYRSLNEAEVSSALFNSCEDVKNSVLKDVKELFAPRSHKK